MKVSSTRGGQSKISESRLRPKIVWRKLWLCKILKWDLSLILSLGFFQSYLHNQLRKYYQLRVQWKKWIQRDQLPSFLRISNQGRQPNFWDKAYSYLLWIHHQSYEHLDKFQILYILCKLMGPRFLLSTYISASSSKKIGYKSNMLLSKMRLNN